MQDLPNSSWQEPTVNDLSKQGQRLVEIIETNNLNKVSGFAMQDLIRDISIYESRIPNKPVSNAVKTAALVEQAVNATYRADFLKEDPMRDYDNQSPARIARQNEVATEAKAITKMAFNDPVINPSKPVYGDGYVDIKATRLALASGADISSMILPKGMTPDRKEALLLATERQPEAIQQVIVQGMRAAADDARKQSAIGSVKTTSLIHAQDVISDTLDAYQAFKKDIGEEVLGRTLTERFATDVYDVRGLQQFEANKNNPYLASKNPVAQVTRDLGSAHANNMADGLNRDIQQLKDLSGHPHTKAGDWRIKDITGSINNTTKKLASSLNVAFDSATIDKPVSKDVAYGYIEVRDILEDTKKLLEELPERDRMLERNVDRAIDHLSNSHTASSVIMKDRIQQAHAEQAMKAGGAAPAAPEAPKADEAVVRRGPSGP